MTIARLYGYADAVQVKTKLPDDAKGLKVAEVAIAAGQTEGKLIVEAAADAAPGNFTLDVQAVSKFNGQELSVARNVAVTVEKVEAAK